MSFNFYIAEWTVDFETKKYFWKSLIEGHLHTLPLIMISRFFALLKTYHMIHFWANGREISLKIFLAESPNVGLFTAWKFQCAGFSLKIRKSRKIEILGYMRPARGGGELENVPEFSRLLRGFPVFPCDFPAPISRKKTEKPERSALFKSLNFREITRFSKNH